MGKIRKFFSLVPVLILWLMLSVLVWGFVFTRITDTDPAHKITLFVDSEVTDAMRVFQDMIEKGVLAVSVSYEPAPEGAFAQDCDINGKTAALSVKKA